MRNFLSRSKVVKKPNVPQYNPNPQTIGEHIRKKRIEGKLSQKAVADQLEVEENTITGWELERSQPLMKHYPAIIRFLGYYPFDHETDSLAGKLKHLRHCHGLSFKECARRLSISVDAAMRWERGKPVAYPSTRKLIIDLWQQLPSNLLQHPV
ncbi:helix-turn-helix domain-containing protein [Mucilaginibacter sp. ZT4R22]|uniref:Helix-turn-helix domain-containing protein n=1 Tax=Mucilaginibacter pankratovii TaxID=2772110 RepID=A0ABR7WMW1_9SPHI|nr:helix-turn-helix domain-containing protein [Mucilaginibacter pankratovii]MBD1363486.1 helix-turn-helix domain-containing protein [Mucilaginibacter pankratovii]